MHTLFAFETINYCIVACVQKVNAPARYLWQAQKRFMFLMPQDTQTQIRAFIKRIYKNITKTQRYEYTLKALVSICFIVWVLFVDEIIQPYLDSIFGCDLNKRGFC